jgi:hypothetical protein
MVGRTASAKGWMSMRHRNRGIAASFLTIVAVALVGCTANPVAATVVPSTKAVVAPSVSATPSPTAAAADGVLAIDPAKAKTVTISCSDLVPDSTITAFGTEFAAVDGYTPKAGSPTAEIADANGTACEWMDPSTGSTLAVAVAHPGATDLLNLKNTLVDISNSVPTYGEEAYFQLASGTGEVDAFHGKYWIVAISPDFYEPGDASAVISAVDDAIDAR